MPKCHFDVHFSEKDTYDDTFYTMYVGKAGYIFPSNKVQMTDHCTYAPGAVSLETSRSVKSLPFFNVTPDGWLLN